MFSEKQLRTIVFLLQVVFGVASLIAAYAAITAIVDFSKFTLVFQQLTKSGKVTNNPFRNIDAGLLRLMILMTIFSILQILTGFFVRVRILRSLCALVFAIEWLSWPLGTILGSLGLYWVARDWTPKLPEAAK
jgi:hypothetical protein